MRVKLFLVVVIVFALATEARAQVFTKNQILLAGTSPATIPVTYDTGTSLTGTIPLGTPVHIVYGVQVTSSNASPSSVSLSITVPPAFTQTQIHCLRFAGGLNPGTPFTAGCSTPIPPTLAIGALSGAGDKVIVAIDGFFTQAGTFTATFAASRGATTETTSLNMDANTTQLPVDLEIVKLTKPKTGGTFGPTATIPFGAAVTYQITVRNLAAPDPTNHTTDLYLGRLLKVQDTISAPAANDVNLSINAASFSPCTATGGADCPTLPTSAATSLGPSSGTLLFAVSYPAASNGFLPAGGSFTFTFDATVTTGSLCSPGQNNNLLNTVSLTYSNSANTISDTNPANNMSTATVALTGLPTTGCASGAPTLPMTKQLIAPSTPAWGVPFKYRITITNNTSQTLTGLTLGDFVGGNGTPPFTATFSAASVVCTPGCIAPQPVSSAPYVTNSFAALFNAAFAPLAPNAVQTVDYTVQYDTICSPSGSGGSITNFASLNGPAKGNAIVSTAMPAVPQCDLLVTKTRVSGPATFSSFPVTLGYKVVFKNNSLSQTVKVGTLADAMAYESPAYATNIPVVYSYTCTASSTVTMPAGAVMSKTAVAALIQYNNPVYAGVRILDFSSSPGAVFGPLGTVTCDVTVTLQQPPADDSKCQGSDPKNVDNIALMDPSPGNFTNPFYKAPVPTPLPKCVSILVGKTVSANVVTGGPVTFTLTVKNSGNDPTPPNIKLTDNVPISFTGVTWTCASGCVPASGSGNSIATTLSPIAPGATTTVVVHATAPTVLGTTCNRDDATFNPFPADTFFEGDQAALTTASACVQVQSPTAGTGLTVQKKVEGAPPGFTGQFTFLVQCATPTGFLQQTVTVNWPTPGVITLNNIPAGSHCKVTEGPLPSPLPAGFNWDGLPTYLPDNGVITTTEAGGQVAVINKIKPCIETGQVKITKVLAGLPPGYSGTFQGVLQCWSGGTLSTYPVTLTAPGSLTATINNIPLNSTCTLQETAQASLPAGMQWDPPVYSPTFGTVTLTGLCCQEITLTNKARACCENAKELDTPNP